MHSHVESSAVVNDESLHGMPNMTFELREPVGSAEFADKHGLDGARESGLRTDEGVTEMHFCDFKKCCIESGAGRHGVQRHAGRHGVQRHDERCLRKAIVLKR